MAVLAPGFSLTVNEQASVQGSGDSSLVEPGETVTNVGRTQSPAGASNLAGFVSDVGEDSATDEAQLEPSDVPTGLRTNLLEDATSVDKDAVTFSWQNPSGIDQASYRITVRHRMGSQSIVDRTDWIRSDQQTSVQIVRLGEVLEDNSLYTWTVEVSDDVGSIVTSEPATFATAVGSAFASTDFVWTASSSVSNLVRATVPALPDGARALLTVSALDSETARRYVSSVYANGVEVAVGPNRRSADNLFYNTYDVTDQLSDTTNTIGTYNFSQSLDSGVLIQLSYFTSDGASSIVYNSGRDREQTQVIPLDDVVQGLSDDSIGTGYYTELAQYVDVARFPADWWIPGDTTSTGWGTPANVEVPSSYVLTPAITAAMVRQPMASASIASVTEDCSTVDFGKEVLGDIQLHASASTSAPVRLMLGEELDDDGMARHSLRTGNDYDETWTFSGTDTTFAGYSLKGFRYATVCGYPGVLGTDDIWALSTSIPLSGAGSLTTNSDLANAIVTLTTDTQLAATQDTIVDSVTRERAAYEGDLLVYDAMAGYLGDDLAASRNTWNRLLNAPSDYTEYRLAAVLGVHTDYLRTADTSYVRSVYDHLQTALDAVTVDPILGLVRSSGATTDIVDWPSAEVEGDSLDAVTYKTVVNVFAWRAYADMADLARAVGREAEADRYAETASVLRDTINNTLYSEDRGHFIDGLTALGLPVAHDIAQSDYTALALGVVEDPDRIATMVEEITEQDAQVTGSIYMAAYFYEGLAVNGAGDTALDILLKEDRDDVRSYAYVLDVLGATMTPEAWDPSIKNNMSFSHAWGTGGGSGLFNAVFGIRPTSPAYATYDLSVSLGPLENAEASVPTLRGDISVTARRGLVRQDIEVTTTVPSGTMARFSFPEANADSLIIVDGETRGTGTETVMLEPGEHTAVLLSPSR
jgi:hypothetical protein